MTKIESYSNSLGWTIYLPKSNNPIICNPKGYEVNFGSLPYSEQKQLVELVKSTEVILNNKMGLI